MVVTQYGAVREVLRARRTEPRIDLATVVELPNAYAVGALEKLEGEITIVDGQVWVARAKGDSLSVSGPAVVASDRATLLTLSHVTRWMHLRLANDLSGDDLELAVRQHARDQGIDTDSPFPFLIEGEVKLLEAHVIAGSCPLSSSSDGAEPWRLSVDKLVDATLVGFFANNQAGSMTHHGTSVHMHIVLVRNEQTITAHVDKVAMTAGSILRLPK